MVSLLGCGMWGSSSWLRARYTVSVSHVRDRRGGRSHWSGPPPKHARGGALKVLHSQSGSAPVRLAMTDDLTGLS